MKKGEVTWKCMPRCTTDEQVKSESLYARQDLIKGTIHCMLLVLSLFINLPPEAAVYFQQTTMPPHPATDASELAKFELLKHGFHERPAFVLEELGSL